MEKYKESLEKALKHLNVADHIIYITYPIIRDKRLLLKSLDSIYETIINLINAILQYEYLWKRIQLSKNPKENFETFKNKSLNRLGMSLLEINQILEILSLIEKHKKSPIEFQRKERIVIMSDNLQINTIDTEKMKIYLNLTKIFLKRAKAYMNLSN